MKSQIKTILCYGDSNTYGFNPLNKLRWPEDVRWTGILRELLGGNYRIIEEGCNGRTAACTPEEEPWKDGRDYLKACLNSHKPLDAVVLMLGLNDLKTRFALSPEEIAGGIGWMLHTTAEFLEEKQGSVPYILLVSPHEIGEGIVHTEDEAFDAGSVLRSRALAPLYEAAAFEYAESTLNPCGFLDAARIIKASEEDCLHLMPGEHRILAEAIAHTLQAYL